MGRFLLGILLCAFLLTGCAYFNTFYNAKKQFNAAEKAYRENPPEVEISSSQRELYEQAIKKTSKILVFYPNSKYVDDALFLMGKAYFRMEEFGKARRKFEELLANYPQSKFRFEAGYLLGTIHYYMDDENGARDALTEVIDSPKKNSWSDDARYTLGEMAFWKGNYRVALDEYAKIRQDYPNSELKAEGVFMTGECHFKLERYEEALAAYQEARKFEFAVSKRYQIDMRIGECYRKLHQYSDALETFERLARSDRYADHLPEIHLRISEVHYLLGDTTRAIQGYQDIARQNEKTKEAAWAHYQLGLIQMEGLANLEGAKESFDKSKAESPTSEAAHLASLKRSQINKLEEYRQKAASADSLQLAEAHFVLAEVYLLDMNRPDSALFYYQKVIQEHPLSSYAPRSAYVAAWITENSLADTAASRQLYEQIIADYPLSESANAARKRLGQPAVLDTSQQDAAQRLGQAEELLLRYNDPDGALEQYQSILVDLPGSPFAPKAECAVAWTLEHFKGDRDSAMAIYKRLAERYPDSECALLAEKKTAPPRTPVVADTTVQAAVDTTEAGSVIQQPEADEEEKPEQDDQGEDEEARRRSRRRPLRDESSEEP